MDARSGRPTWVWTYCKNMDISGHIICPHGHIRTSIQVSMIEELTEVIRDMLARNGEWQSRVRACIGLGFGLGLGLGLTSVLLPSSSSTQPLWDLAETDAVADVGVIVVAKTSQNYRRPCKTSSEIPARDFAQTSGKDSPPFRPRCARPRHL